MDGTITEGTEALKRRAFGDPFSPARSHASAWQPLQVGEVRNKLGDRPGKAYNHPPRRAPPFVWNPAADEADRIFGEVTGWSSAGKQSSGGFIPLLPKPPAEDLQGLYALCGGSEDALINHLAKVHGLPPQDLAPTILLWLADTPEIPPPSRQRSAPPVLAVTGSAGGRAASILRGVPRARPPPQSAAGDIGRSSSDSELAAAMRAVDTRLNRTPARHKDWSSVPLPGDTTPIHRHAAAMGASPSSSSLWLGFSASNNVPNAWLGYPLDGVPEDQEGHEGAAVSNYLQRSAGRLHASMNRPPEVPPTTLVTRGRASSEMVSSLSRSHLRTLTKYPWSGSAGRL